MFRLCMGTKLSQLTNRSLCVLCSIKLDNTGTTGASVRLVLDLSTLDLANCREQLDEILVAGGPGKLLGFSKQCEGGGGSSATYVADVDCGAALAAGCREVGEWIWCSGRSWPSVKPSNRAALAAVATSTKTATTAKPASKTAATSKSTAADTETSTASEASTKAATTTERWWSGEPILADFECPTLPIIAVELSDSVTSILGGFECDDTGSFRATIGCDVDISPDDRACDS